ncbi:MAG: hypothetical protein AB7L17_21340 [Ilumatobacteraceae bacterium]
MLAHQGGWDEVLLIVVPMLAVAALLRLAKRRVEHTQLRPDETLRAEHPERSGPDA